MTLPVPAVSVVMPVRNVERSIDATMRSLVGQTLREWELVVVDDGSTDATVARLRAWAAADRRIVVHVDGRNQGISARLNQGVARCRAELVARMDGDDICYPQRLEKQVAYLRAHPDVDLVGAGEMVFSSDGTPRGPRTVEGGHELVTADVLHGIPLSHPTWLGRRRWFVEHPYDGRRNGCEDQDVLLRAHRTSRYANMPDVLLAYREDGIKLRRSVRTRFVQGGMLVRWGLRNGRFAASLLAAAEHLARGARDALAVATHQERRVLARRVRTPTAAERSVFAELWNRVNLRDSPERVGP
ncbi:glycosyltransferase family 2 protein [Pseudonocardia sp. TRM90224]|uniref:glycosyltransferase family 2 protein n=1 Tax=Pseudonocardia sp. TRM90224 TaxID=2812678 RepID=UPI001E44CF29|nr:glycosyltransferase family 2 protein [Pseudonocardia sp. TRM90224]